MITTVRETENEIIRREQRPVTRVTINDADTVTYDTPVRSKAQTKPLQIFGNKTRIEAPAPDLSEGAELMPSIKVNKEAKAAAALSAKAKAALVAYLAVALILSIIVLATGLAITNATGQLNAQENALQQKIEVATQQQASISALMDQTSIEAKAAANGLTKNAEVNPVKLIKLTKKLTYEERTNVFDQICDFLSGIIGG